MKRYFVETSAIINYLRGNKDTVNLIENIDSELTSSFICMAELYEGIHRVKKDKQNIEKGVINFFEALSEVFGLDREIAKKFGQIRASLKEQGTVIEDIDIIIAATCLSHDLILITNNTKHFSRIKDLQIKTAAVF